MNRAMRKGSKAHETVWFATKAAEHGFTFVELIIGMAMFLIAVGVAVLLGGVGIHKSSSDRDELRGLLIRARTQAIVSGAGTTLAIAPKRNGGTEVTLYSRSASSGATVLRSQWSETLDETVADEYGRTSVIIVFEPSGAAVPARWTTSQGTLAELGCPGAISLTTTSGEGLLKLDPPLQVDCRSGQVGKS